MTVTIGCKELNVTEQSGTEPEEFVLPLHYELSIEISQSSQAQ